MILTPAEVERWLSHLEARFEQMAADIEDAVAEECNAEAGEFAGNRARQASAKLTVFLTDFLAARLRSGNPIYQKDLDYLSSLIAKNLAVD